MICAYATVKLASTYSWTLDFTQTGVGSLYTIGSDSSSNLKMIPVSPQKNYTFYDSTYNTFQMRAFFILYQQMYIPLLIVASQWNRSPYGIYCASNQGTWTTFSNISSSRNLSLYLPDPTYTITMNAIPQGVQNVVVTSDNGMTTFTEAGFSTGQGNVSITVNSDPDAIVSLNFQNTSVNKLTVTDTSGVQTNISTSTGTNVHTFKSGDTLTIGTKPNPSVNVIYTNTAPPTTSGGIIYNPGN